MNLSTKMATLFNIAAKQVDNKREISYELSDEGKDLVQTVKHNTSQRHAIGLAGIKEEGKQAFDSYMAQLFSAISGEGVITRDGRVIDRSIQDLFMDARAFAKDFHSYPAEFPFLLGDILTMIIKQPIAAKYLGISLMKKVSIPANIQNIDAMYMNITGSAKRVDYGMEYPITKFSTSAKKFTGSGLIGTKVSIPNHVKTNPAGVPILALLLEAAIDVIYRFRETEIFDLICNQSGTIIFDNGSGSYNNTSGRNSSGVCNGTFTQDDLFTMAAALVDLGYTPNIILISPMTWLLWCMDPFMRQFNFWNGTGSYAERHKGDQGDASMYSMFGKPNVGAPFTPLNVKTTYSDVPKSFPYPLEVVTSPYVTNDSTAKTATIIVADKDQLGMIVETNPLRTREWESIEHETTFIKVDLGYHLYQSNEGKGIAIANKVVYGEKAFDFGSHNTFRTLTMTSDLDAPGTSPIV